MIGKQFRDRLIKIMAEKGINGNKLAELADVQPCSITLYKQGKRIPRINTMIKLAKALDVPYEELSGDETPEMTERQIYAKRLCDLSDLCLLSEKYKKMLRKAASLLTSGEENDG